MYFITEPVPYLVRGRQEHGRHRQSVGPFIGSLREALPCLL